MGTQDGEAMRPAVPLLIEALGREGPGIGAGAAFALCRIAEKLKDGALFEPAWVPLIEQLGGAENPEARRRSAWALGAIAPLIADPGMVSLAIEPLIEVLQPPWTGYNEGYLSQDAAIALGTIAPRLDDTEGLRAATSHFVALLEEEVCYAYWAVASSLATVALNTADADSLDLAVSELARALEAQKENVYARRQAASQRPRIPSTMRAMPSATPMTPSTAVQPTHSRLAGLPLRVGTLRRSSAASPPAPPTKCRK